MSPEEITTRYAAYLAACNRHALGEIGQFLAPQVVVNGRVKTPDEYVGDLADLFEIFPDYSWTLVRSVVQDSWLAVHLEDRGTRSKPFHGAPGNGARVTTDEFAMYRRDAKGRIEHVEVTADNARLMAG